MTKFVLIALTLSSLAMTQPTASGENPLQGVWIAQSMEANGKPAPADAVKRMQFTFKGDKLYIKGNFDDDREEECPYKIDPKQSPKHLEFSPPKEKKPILGIYEVKGNELKLCLRHGSSSGGRPTAFQTKTESGLVLILLKKQAK
jgi:uncharacterized protein (TIGR03067 family)